MNKKISNLVQLSDPQGTDILPITDVSDPTGSLAGTTKRISLANIVNLANVGNLRASNNLSDVSSASSARTNLGLGSLALQNSVGGAELRGTDNPHIGAFPNQSFLVTDNPSQSVMVVADSGGNLKFLVNSDTAKLFLVRPSLTEEITTGLSVKEDSTEPDIELTTSTGTYSLITGDSDTFGANGLPLRQGFNTPDIGANQASLLISGGTIS